MDQVKINVILVPVDFSEYMEQVVGYAASLARRFGSTLKLLHVVQIPILPEAINWMGAGVPTAVETGIAEDLVKTAKQNLNKLKQSNQVQDLPIEIIVAEGVPFVEIIRMVGQEQADLVVMGSHGRTGISHLLMGSVAEKVVRKAPCPVLCIKPEGFKFEMP